eukprot:NODE_6873_length_811_cov_35.643895_g6637_i0.p1 GENE.NODE_6873_length_811_cov_35.643895_g6637_i0~~NODE_6873_length_811_cov_35.643895_g6637_i0.p1  ORF type:complete len:206 (-),score=31.19 NODE_6873_length_811_cov_35.643895_g6637_i0:126-743(-)
MTEMEQRFSGFCHGVAAIFTNWTALRLVGQNSIVCNAPQLIQELQEDIIEWFRAEGLKEEIYHDQLAEYIDSMLRTSLGADVEDGSVAECSRLICLMFQECIRGISTTLEKVLAIKAIDGSKEGQAPTVAPVDGDDDDDMGDDDEDMEGGAPSAAAPAPEPNFFANLPTPVPEQPQEQQAPPKPRPPRKPKATVDKNGWATVSRK